MGKPWYKSLSITSGIVLGVSIYVYEHVIPMLGLSPEISEIVNRSVAGLISMSVVTLTVGIRRAVGFNGGKNDK